MIQKSKANDEVRKSNMYSECTGKGYNAERKKRRDPVGSSSNINALTNAGFGK